MSNLDPFGRPLGGGPSPLGRPGGPRPASRMRMFVVAFVVFDLLVLLVVGGLFAVGAFSGGGSDTVIIPPSAQQAAAADEDGAADDDDDDVTTVVTRESGTSTIIDDDEPAPAAAAASPSASPDDDADDAALTPEGLNATSMLRESNLRPALAALRRLAPGKVLNMAVYPAHVTAQVRSSGGDLVILSARAGQEPQILNRVEGAANHRSDGVSWSSLNPAAPARLIRAANADGTGQRAVNYLVVMPGLAPWALHRKNGQRVPASANGTPRKS